ncbi:MAG: glycerate kinase [Phycisphaerae bacterium]|nr:glycerate kinase [Phycisphaerae bacterium]
MKVVIAPDTFKECLPAAQVAAAMGRGVLEACPEAQVDLCPMADGGEGTVAAMVAATGGRLVAADVFDPLGRAIRAHFGMLGAPQAAPLPGELGLAGAEATTAAGRGPLESGHRTAIIEMAAASGLALVPADKRDPLRATTYGTGQLIVAALNAGAEEIIVGVGNSATVDGGCGAAQAMGVVFLDADGRPLVCGMGGGALGQLVSIDASGQDERIAATRFRVATDVTNPLTGPDGAARVYGPQKGATAEVVEQLDAGLSRLAECIYRTLGVDVEHLPGAGAAGGLAAGLAAFCGATLHRGVRMIARAVGLPQRLTGADLCLTGEGRLDAQSRSGKTCVGVAELAAAAGVPVICIPGSVSADGPSETFAAVRPLVAGEVTVKSAMRRAPALLAQRAAEAVREFLGIGLR